MDGKNVKKNIFYAILPAALIAIGYLSNAEATTITAEKTVKNATVELIDGETQLCLDSQRNGKTCSRAQLPQKVSGIQKISQTRSFENAPYSWIATGKNIAYACAAGEQPNSQIKCFTLRVNLEKVQFEIIDGDVPNFEFMPKKPSVNIATVISIGKSFALAYAKAEGFLRAHAKHYWSTETTMSQKIASASGGMSTMGTGCGFEEESDDDFCSGDPEQGGGGDGTGGGVSSGGGEGTGGGEASGGGEGGDGKGIDPTTGKPPYTVPVVGTPPPKLPTDPNWCNMLGLFCSSPDSPSSPSPTGPSKETCDQMIAQCRKEGSNIYSTNKEALPGTGTDYSGRLSRYIRECAARYGCSY